MIFSQENILRNYQVSINGTNQKLSLSELKNNQYEGYVISWAYEYKGKHYTGFGQKDLFHITDKLTVTIDSVNINTKKAFRLMKKLKSKGIERLKDDEGNYILRKGEEIVVFTGGGNPTLFKVKTKKSDKKIRFHNLDYKMDKKHNGLNNQRIKASKLYNILMAEIDFNKYWREFNYKYKISEYNPFIKHKDYIFPKPEFNKKIISIR